MTTQAIKLMTFGLYGKKSEARRAGTVGRNSVAVLQNLGGSTLHCTAGTLWVTVEGDLKAGRYRSALRRRDVLIEGLGEVKTYLKGEFTVRQDQTANLPTDIQKEILGSMQEPSPPGWEELNRQYFERLTTAPATAAEQPAMATQAPNPPQAEKK